jgi:hypothetical protein
MMNEAIIIIMHTTFCVGTRAREGVGWGPRGAQYTATTPHWMTHHEEDHVLSGGVAGEQVAEAVGEGRHAAAVQRKQQEGGGQAAVVGADKLLDVEGGAQADGDGGGRHVRQVVEQERGQPVGPARWGEGGGVVACRPIPGRRCPPRMDSRKGHARDELLVLCLHLPLLHDVNDDGSCARARRRGTRQLVARLQRVRNAVEPATRAQAASRRHALSHQGGAGHTAT